MIPMNNSNSFVKFFDPKVLKKERELIDSWDYEICNQYGMDCLFISQKNKFPKVIKSLPLKYPNETSRPDQNDLFFHAYGEFSRPEYNEPFTTRVYVQFTEDLFAINGFGLNTDLNTTLIFNKTSFALDGAMAMGDTKTINKQFKFNMEVEQNNPYAIINYKSNGLKFKARFNWKNALKRLESGDLYEFDIDPGNLVKPDVVNTFKRRYSANKFIEAYKLYFKVDKKVFNKLTGNYKISGNCIANFVIKNPWKAYSEFLNRITPSVGDLVFLNGVDDNIIKLELTEVEAENKTAQGISPLLGSYSFKCTAKPYIADNNASNLHDPITAPTDINAKKLIIQTIMNHDASKIADNVSKYKKLYTDEMGFDFTEDDIYGGYDLEPPVGLNNPPNVPVKHHPINSNERVSYKWDRYKDYTIEIKDENGKLVTTYSPDDLFTYLKNLMDNNFTDYLVQQIGNTELSVSYSLFDKNPNEMYFWHDCMALNVKLWYDDRTISTKTTPKKINTVSAYTLPDRRLKQIENDPELFNSFISANMPFINYMNAYAYEGNSSKYKIPLMEPSLSSTYIDLLKDKKDVIPIDISSSNVYELSAFHIPSTEISNGKEVPITAIVERYVKYPKTERIPVNLRTDLYDIEQYNIGSTEFEEVVKTTTPQYKQWKEINVKKMNGPLVEIYKFENNDNSRLATNGESLFFETTHDGKLYRYEISDFELNKEITGKEASDYEGLSVPLSGKLNWLEANNIGVYFNNAYGKRIRLYGRGELDESKLSQLNYENDFTSPKNSFILTFKNSKFYLTVQPTQDGPFSLKLCQ